jgi:drug/metabolite transporter (DMT)-like permease
MACSRFYYLCRCVLRLKKNFVLLHLIVFIWGWTAILGKLISIKAVDLVWYRLLIAVPAILAYMLVMKVPLHTDLKSVPKFFGVGLIIALHWYFFYESIKVGDNVSVTLAFFASGTLFVSFLEPLFFRRKILPLEILFGLIVMAGILIIFRFELRPEYKLAAIYSLLAAFLSALFTVLNGILVRTHDSRVITFYEFISGLAGISIFLFAAGRFDAGFFSLSGSDLGYLLLLGLVCTALAFVISIEIMKEISPFSVVLAVNLEPIYGIILGFLIFGEQMTWGFYIGSLVVIATLFANAWLKKKLAR